MLLCIFDLAEKSIAWSKNPRHDADADFASNGPVNLWRRLCRLRLRAGLGRCQSVNPGGYVCGNVAERRSGFRPNTSSCSGRSRASLAFQSCPTVPGSSVSRGTINCQGNRDLTQQSIGLAAGQRYIAYVFSRPGHHFLSGQRQGRRLAMLSIVRVEAIMVALPRHRVPGCWGWGDCE